MSALRAPQIGALAQDNGPLQLSLFDEVNSARDHPPGLPGERLVCCRNPPLATERARIREALLSATELELAKVKRHRCGGPPLGPGQDRASPGTGRQPLQDGQALLLIEEGSFSFSRRQEAIAAEAALDGIYVLRTSLCAKAALCGRRRAQLRVARRHRKGLSFHEVPRHRDPAHPPPPRPPGARPRLALPACCSSRLAPAQGPCPAHFRRRGTTVSRRPGGKIGTLGLCSPQGSKKVQ